MTEAWTERQGESLETVGLMMRWQADCMRAFADGRPPLPPPPGVDLGKLMQQQQRQGGGGGPGSMMSQVAAAQAVDSTPFTGDEAAFQSEVVRDEYKRLCSDHSKLIRLGEAFGAFDPLGKLAYLDEVEAVEARWDVFFSRFELLGALNADFKQQTAAFLESLGMDATAFREVLKCAHEWMRKEAEEERRQMG